MVNILGSVLESVLRALYEPFGFALLMAALVMVFYLSVQEKGGGFAAAKEIIKKWKNSFLHDRTFRRFFLLVFYTVMILSRTLLNRDLWLNPLSKIMGGWTLVDEDGALSTEPIENLLLFIPFSVLLLWALHDKLLQGKKSLWLILQKSAAIVFLFSLTIEFLQLLLRVGTFQLSDLFYNTLGGFLGGILYWTSGRLRGRKSKKDRHGC